MQGKINKEDRDVVGGGLGVSKPLTSKNLDAPGWHTREVPKKIGSESRGQLDLGPGREREEKEAWAGGDSVIKTRIAS